MLTYSTRDASKENYDKISTIVNFLQFQILRHILDYEHEYKQWPTAQEVYDYLTRIGHVYDKITIYARLTELRKSGMIVSAGKKKRFTMNKLTDFGKAYTITLITRL